VNDTSWHWIGTRVPVAFGEYLANGTRAAVLPSRDHQAICSPMQRNHVASNVSPKKSNQINLRHSTAKPVSVSVTAPVRSRWANPLFCKVCRLGDRSQHRLPGQIDD
jgi:hypothetical protein